MDKFPRKTAKRGEILRTANSWEVAPLIKDLSYRTACEAWADLRAAIRKAGGNPDNVNQQGGTVLQFLSEQIEAKKPRRR